MDYRSYDNVKVMDHPLIQHKLTILRDVNTGVKEFRELVEELAMLMGYEVTRNLTVEEVEVETPICTTKSKVIAGKKLGIVPILRAGLGMVDGMLRLIPAAKVGHIGLYRDPETLKPVEYYCKLPSDVAERDLIVLDPMLATGSSMVLAYEALRTKGHPAHIHVASIIASKQAIEYIQRKMPDDITTVWVAAIDDELDDHSYIVPGLGDAGDLSYGEKE